MVIAKKWYAKNVELIERDGWIKLKAFVWIEGRGGKGFERPLYYIGRKEK